jgi:hypothetical protein
MPLPIIAVETPQQRTCASYKVARLGMHPFMEMVFTETVNDVVALTIVSATDTDDDSKFDTLVVSVTTTGPGAADWREEIVGKSLVKSDDSVLGVCESLLGDSVKLVTGIDADPTGVVLIYTRINGFGEVVARPALGGTSYTRALSAAVPSQFSKMQEVLGTVAFTLVSAVIAQLGLTASPQDIGAALQTLAASGSNLDSFIVQELEALQEAIDNGEVNLD